jgi:transglutaminase-like putative cysteine protease
VQLLRPLPRSITRFLASLVLLSWVAAMAALVAQSYGRGQPATLATDLARYGSAATWRGIYYRGEKIGFTVSQTLATDEGFDLEETGRLQMSLLGATTAATLKSRAQVDRDFALRAFEFSLDPGTGPIAIRGRMNGLRLTLEITTKSGTRTEERDLPEPPAVAQSLPRRLASGGLVPGTKHQWTLFDPATLRNSPVTITVGSREVVRAGSARLPAFRVEMEFAGIRTTSWITDTGEIVREESPLGLITVRETPEAAQALAVSDRMRVDLLQTSSVVPKTSTPITDPGGVIRMRMQLGGADLTAAGIDALNGGAQRLDGSIVELVDSKTLRPTTRDPDAARFLAPEPLIESDAPEIIAEAHIAVRGVSGDRARAERLTRYVNALLEKKPTVSLPSAREVLRTKVGDCNEHTALFVAMARALGIPARIAVGLVYVHGAFYYHAWPEVYLSDGEDRGLWLPVDPTLNQFPVDTTHLRLMRGGLEKQAAILPLLGRLEMTILDVEMAPGTMPVVVGREPVDLGGLAVPLPSRQGRCCRCPGSRP